MSVKATWKCICFTLWFGRITVDNQAFLGVKLCGLIFMLDDAHKCMLIFCQTEKYFLLKEALVITLFKATTWRCHKVHLCVLFIPSVILVLRRHLLMTYCGQCAVPGARATKTDKKEALLELFCPVEINCTNR